MGKLFSFLGHCYHAKITWGLGIRNSELHNKALMPGFVAKLLSGGTGHCFSWLANWYKRHAFLVLLDNYRANSSGCNTARRGIRSTLTCAVTVQRWTLGDQVRATL